MRRVGDRFGRLVIVASAPVAGKYRRRWQVKCDCGTTKIVDDSNLAAGATRSCGCIKREQNSLQHHSRTHGMTGTPEYRIWGGMLTRCRNPKADSWVDYGGRGIKVCERWLKFENFYADMGPRPSPKHTLDRRDVDGDYKTENCRWVTQTEQAQNRRSTTLTWDLVNEIRGRAEHGEAQASIARRLGMRTARVSAVVGNKVWIEGAA